MSTGAIYVALGELHLREACVSAVSMKEQMPGMHITLFSDTEETFECFDRIEKVKSPEYDRRVNIRAMLNTPYRKTLFVDTDTYVCGDMTDPIDLLDRFDMAAALAPGDGAWQHQNIPTSLHQYNCGVLYFSNSHAAKSFLSQWLQIYESDLRRSLSDLYGPSHDQLFPACQPSFRQSFFRGKARIATLLQNYNCRFENPNVVDGEVRLLHGRQNQIEQVAASINNYTGKRFYYLDRQRRLVVKPGASERKINQWLHGLKRK